MDLDHWLVTAGVGDRKFRGRANYQRNIEYSAGGVGDRKFRGRSNTAKARCFLPIGPGRWRSRGFDAERIKDVVAV